MGKVIKEVPAMRRFPFLLLLILAACGSDGIDTGTMLTPEQHVPELANLTLTPDGALYMQGGGTVQVTAEIVFTDLKRDIETLYIRMSDETRLTMSVSESANTVSGTLAETFELTTTDTDGHTIEIWVVDRAGQSSNHLGASFSVDMHKPEISDVTLSPNSALYMEGDGSLVVSADVSVIDTGQDIETLWVRAPDGTTTSFNALGITETGTLTAEFVVSTEQYGEFTVTFWLVDEVGTYSTPFDTAFGVIWDEQQSNWTKQLSGLSYMLTDVIWDGDVFVAVGGDGSILTSVDGIDWLARESGTVQDLYAVSAHGTDIIAVGNEIVLLSTDHGESWVTKGEPVGIRLSTVALNSSQVVIGGWVADTLESSLMISEDRGDTWQAVDSPAVDFTFLTDSTYAAGLYVAAADSAFSIDGGWILVSSDGVVWNEILRYEDLGLNVVVHDGSRFFVAGRGGIVFSSMDGLNWTELQTPVEGVDYLSATWSGSTLMLAGGYSCWHFHYCGPAQFDLPVGLTSNDGGTSWSAFNIDGQYQSRGLAFGSGRFVSVGQSTPVSGEGAIYTAE
jgi:hypothetical protein